MISMYVNRAFPTQRLRETIYQGALWLNTTLDAAQLLCAYADECAVQFLGENPRNADKRMPVEEFVQKVAALKRHFTNESKTKSLVKLFIEEIGEDPDNYLFDLPRLRVVPHYDYLHAGVSYAYKPHRDLWYGGPTCQINTWMPVYPIAPSETMMINPAYFSRPVRNTSDSWDLKDWVDQQRSSAAKNVKQEDRPHPLPLEEISAEGELRVAGDRGAMLIFSGAHLHGTVPNLGDLIRFSVDFRIFHREDMLSGKGAPNIDSGAKNVEYGAKDYFRAANLKPYMEPA